MPVSLATPPRRVLVVDDCALQREMLSTYLEAEGYSVLAVESGAQALGAARGEPFDAVILDVNMPGMDGVDVGLALRRDPATRGAKIAMHTSEDEAVVRSRFGLFDEFLPKPATRAQLGERIGRMMRSDASATRPAPSGS
ncbi:MAG: response regulator [Caldimonas sp.]